ncbi:transposase domain-containing protein [Roseobacter sp. TSBP12]|uniref:transposase domain-containing protein n=1 Tax=Roseobacter sp. TSBP12 TaxID=1236613 RepID=UPI00125F9F63|nr:transposase domain-containing protein [Roseobacter sp. TSBP12]KAB6715832.1 transposase [Roseobacter sp. TSBP12]
MTRLEPSKIWWTADELAAAKLPTLPGTRQGINLLAGAWRAQPGCAQRKAGRGGGWQYHWSVLPLEARKALLVRSETTPDAKPDRGAAWAAFDGLPQKTKDEAARRLTIIQKVEELVSIGTTQVAAIGAIAAQTTKASPRSIYNWLDMIEGVAVDDRLAYLAPRHRLAQRKTTTSAETRPFMEFLKSLFLRLEGPTYKDCYRDAKKVAKSKGWAIVPERTASRRIEKEVPRVTRVFAREGLKGLMRCFPAQIRDRSGLHALEAVNADCHKIDVFVEWPDGTINRPQIIGFQDLYSNKILSWRVDHDPNKVMVMAAFGEMIEHWGIPRRCLFDNGHEFANKWMTGGAKHRFRFKIRDDEPLGVLPLLGIQVTFATPAHGQAKPIERGFRDFASSIAKDVRFAGAYVGNKPTAKPENYGSRAVPAETFLQVLAERVAEHNAREGRLSDTAMGRSFDQTFEESYVKAPIQKASEEQRRLWMMGQYAGKLNKNNGELKFQGNHYHSDWMSEHPSRDVVARFDPEDLHSGVHIYGTDGAYLGFAECRQQTGFFDLSGAQRTAKRVARIKSAEKALLKAHAPISPADLGEALNQAATPALDRPAAKVVRPMFGKTPTKMQQPPRKIEVPANPAVDAAREAMILNLPAKVASNEDAEKAATPGDRFRRAQDILARSEAGQPIGEEEAKWLNSYRQSAEYKGQLLMFKQYGASGIR